MAGNLFIFNSDWMKKYILKGVCLIVLLIVADFAVGKLFSFLHQKSFEKSPYGLVTEYAMYRAEADVIIIGSSRACHHYVPEILADSLKLSVHNCGIDGAFFLYQCCLIDGILNRTKPKMIIWDLDPTCLAGGVSATHRLSDLNPFYDENSFCRDILNRSTPAERYKMLSQSYRYNSRFLAYLYKSIVPYAHPADGYLPIANEGYSYPSLIKRDKAEGFSEELVNYLNVIIDKCKMEGVNLLFSFSPQLTEDDYTETESCRYLCRIAEQENIPLIDFYHHSLFMTDSTLFKDNAHLNDRGARRFTSFMSEKIRKIYNL